MSEEQIICQEVLKKFIYKIRINEMCQLVFHYYTDSEKSETNYPVNTPEYFESFNFDRVKKQIKKKILSNRNNYWNLDDKNIKLVENICTNSPEKFDIFKDYIEYLWASSLEEQTKEFEKEEQELKEKDNFSLKLALGNKYDIYEEVVNLILKDKTEYPYKSDKIKILIEIELDVDTILKVFQIKEKGMSRSYIDKYYKEKQEEIKQRKVLYELASMIKSIVNKLKVHSS